VGNYGIAPSHTGEMGACTGFSGDWNYPQCKGYDLALVVVPLRLGGGMRAKVLEALAAGKAVVASSLAVEGLDLVDGEHVLLAETDQQFCDAIVQLLADPARRTALAAHAYAWAHAQLGWERSIAAYERLYESLMERLWATA